jgi:hypothetical protein
MAEFSSAKSQHISFVQKLYSTIDKMDADGFGKFFAADGTFTLGRFPINIGPDQVSLGASYAFSSLNAIQHEITSVWSTSDGTAMHTFASFYLVIVIKFYFKFLLSSKIFKIIIFIIILIYNVINYVIKLFKF